ncbi:MAG TPA: TonB-dependent receptor, partial [Longimicrobiales bacterium]|nr:TonB-dependent receptor [Longimicrobiales bacterium]
PLARPWEFDDAIDAAVIAVARDTFGVSLEPYTRPYLVRSTQLSGFGRFDWQLANDNHLSVRAGIGSIPSPGADTQLGAAVVPGMLVEGSDLMISSTLGSMFRRTWAHEIRLGVVRTTRDYGVGAPAEPDELPATRIVSGGLRFGTDPRFPGRFDRTNFTTAQSLEIPASRHRIKLGLETDLESHKEDYAYARDGAFVFGGPGDFGTSTGSFFQTSGASEASYSVFRLGGFIQDTWEATPELLVVVGVRADFTSLPGDEVSRNEQWLTYTGVANDSIPSSTFGLSPRLGLTWALGSDRSWIVRASAGSYENALDPAVLSEIVTADGDRTIRRGVGDLDSWPGAPTTTSATELALLGPKFRSPRTNRFSLGLSRPLGLTTRLHVSGTYRHTDFLPRRADLNLFTSPTAHDQHGRPIFGTLVKAGSVIGALATSRRFSDFDRVSALNTDGWSRYLGLTATVERNAGANTALFASYTYSRTTDNWLSGGAAGADGQLTPFPEEG